MQERRDKQFLSENCISRIFSHAVNDNPKPFKAGLKTLSELLTEYMTYSCSLIINEIFQFVWPKYLQQVWQLPLLNDIC